MSEDFQGWSSGSALLQRRAARWLIAALLIVAVVGAAGYWGREGGGNRVDAEGASSLNLAPVAERSATCDSSLLAAALEVDLATLVTGRCGATFATIVVAGNSGFELALLRGTNTTWIAVDRLQIQDWTAPLVPAPFEQASADALVAEAAHLVEGTPSDG